MSVKASPRTYEYPVNERHSTVLGYPAKTSGRGFWSELIWDDEVRTDGGQHFLNPCGGEYLHVKAADPGEDWDGVWFRVRCVHEIGSKWRGGVVSGVRVERRHHGWFWIVEVTNEQ